MGHRGRWRGSRSLAAFAPALVLTSAAALAQEAGRDSRTFVVPPPSPTSTGGAASEVPAALHAPPRLRGKTLETRDVLHADEIELVGLEQSSRPYRADLELDRSPLGEHAAPDGTDNGDLHRRQLAIYSGERATRLPELVRESRGVASAGEDPAEAGMQPPSTRWSYAALAGLVASYFAVRRKFRRAD